MTFEEKIVGLAERIPSLMDHLATEEATKNALIMPFISALGYDVFNPKEVVPEFIADHGIKKGEKVDYAIKNEGEVIIIIECKDANNNISKANKSQLYRYFGVTNARIAVLTNGVKYLFYSDLEESNKMDKVPFLELDLLNLQPDLLAEVKKMGKENFDLDRMLSIVSEMKSVAQIKNAIADQFKDPSDEFVKFFFTMVNNGERFAGGIREQFTGFVKKAANQFVNEKLTHFLDSAKAVQSGGILTDEDEAPESDNGIVTTEEEMEGFHIVKAILCQKLPPARIALRDTKSYFGILLDDNNRKPLCRLHFNTQQKYIGLFDADRKETRHPIEAVTDIYLHAGGLLAGIAVYEGAEV